MNEWVYEGIMKKFWWARKFLDGRPMIELFDSDVFMISLINCVIDNVNNNYRWLTLFLDNENEFLITWEFNSIGENCWMKDKIWLCYMHDILEWRCVWKLKWNIENGCYKMCYGGKVIILERAFSIY